jgi:hypothetical protein
MIRFSGHNRRFAVVLSAALLTLSSGCKAPWSSDWKLTDMFRLDKGMPWDDDGPAKGVPVRLVGTWADTVLQQAGKTPQRGFGGRLIFYGKKTNEPILVDGQLVIYAFDESNREPTDNRPTRRYVFPPDQVAQRMSETELGPSYSFWLPWDEVGGPQTDISLIARFEPQGGAVVVSEQTKHLLPGPLMPRTMLAQNTPPKLPDGVPMRPAVKPMSYSSGDAGGTANQAALAIYESPVAGVDATTASGMPGGVAMPHRSERRMTTTSISLPESFRLRGGAPPPRAASHPTVAEPTTAAPRAPTPAPASPNSHATSSPTPGMMPGTMPYVPSPAVTPLSQSASAANVGLGANLALPSAQTVPGQVLPGQVLPGQQQMPAATEVTTSVSYLSPAESARWGVGPQHSTGYQPATPPAPATPASR